MACSKRVFPCSDANLSIAKNPALCRVFVYFSPGFPNAKMTFIDLVYHLVKITYNKHMAKRDDDLEFSINAPFDDGRAVIDKVPLYLVNGSLGAGKTSVLEFLLQQSDYKGFSGD